MNCPNCGTEMESGVLMTGGPRFHPIIWAKSGPGWIRSPKGREELSPPGGDTVPSQVIPTYPDAHRCTACKTVVFQYE